MDKAKAGPREDNMKIMVHVLDKTIVVSCGTGSQRMQWLGHVGIARYDEEHLQGWLQLGKPAKITSSAGVPFQANDVICEVLQDKDHVYVEPTRQP
ncbi:hypothetical protein SDRG_14236 [Saprolegnia diclina VS20]|uniref:Par3/HAL N-terminal domain-containing protein n=1 Tax=Saprolegnia diclina (strain VS20) TaxID=1156394 RepID=T0Q3J9_SAPDV|nr:hypothetical protein SDRG_14236 [Saprolegnia diclina VS20]EQC27960.1 hypothetical protein SDRG_14236 [Saprolegnia diclina VS20]|eukprot:XP_008618573.1 hypothetical protein SDRG_14236 [Saprolegnia diclina VS20]